MEKKYEEMARNLENQPRKRYTIKKRRFIPFAIAASIVSLALIVAGFQVAMQGIDKSLRASDMLAADQINEGYYAGFVDGYNSTYSAVAEDYNTTYYEDFCSAENIGVQGKEVLNEYETLKKIIEKENLKVDSSTIELNNKKLAANAVDYNEFKVVMDNDMTDYTKASDIDRLKKAGYIYEVKEGVLLREVVELRETAKYLTEGTPEYAANQKAISDIEDIKISEIDGVLNYISGKLPTNSEFDKTEDGMQR